MMQVAMLVSVRRKAMCLQVLLNHELLQYARQAGFVGVRGCTWVNRDSRAIFVESAKPWTRERGQKPGGRSLRGLH